MIHLIADGDTLTAVIDERDVEMESIIEAIRSGLAEYPGDGDQER